MEQTLLAPGGIVASLKRTWERWAAPNGWAPLQWTVVAGLRTYGHRALANATAIRLLRMVQQIYSRTGRTVETMSHRARPGGGGEYPLQDGFGWTNGVARAWRVSILTPCATTTRRGHWPWSCREWPTPPVPSCSVPLARLVAYTLKW